MQMTMVMMKMISQSILVILKRMMYIKTMQLQSFLVFLQQARTAGGVTADDAADLQEGYGNDSLRAEFRDRIDSLQKRKDARKEDEYSRNKYFEDKMRKQAQRNIRAKLFSKK